MRLTPHERDNFHFIAIGLCFFIAALSIFLAVTLGKAKDASIRQDLRQTSQTVAAALGPDQVMQLKGVSEDAELSVYSDLKHQLAGIKKIDHKVRSIYLAGQRGGRLFFYVDSEQPSSDQYSPAAQWYDDATPEFKSVFKTGQPLVEGPVSDSFGSFISGLAPILTPNSDKVTAVIGMDVDASAYWRDIIFAAALPLASGLCLILVITIFEWIRRRNVQLLALRSELVSVASHELRNPITGIRWAAESVQRLTTDPKVQPLARAILNSAIRLQASTDEILELTHAMNRRELSIAPADLTKLIHEVLDTQALSAQQKSITLELSPTWPAELTVNCDAEKLKRVLHNLISNSIKYSGEHTKVAILYASDEQMHRISISDQGIGIPVDEQAKVFKGFYRASNAVASKLPGTGLGLYLVKTVIEQHGGNVSFVSGAEKGTTFTLSLPKR
jgi:signal transduction histidine kinase